MTFLPETNTDDTVDTTTLYTLSGKQRRYLRSLGHDLRPLVLLGKGGLTENVFKQIEQNLVAHELVKIKLPKLFGEERTEFAKELTEGTQSELVQILGHVALIYRPHPKEPKISLPRH